MGRHVLPQRDGRPPEKLSTSSDAANPADPDEGSTGTRRVRARKVDRLDDGGGSLSLRTLGDGDVRLFGVALERDRARGRLRRARGARGARLVLEREDPADLRSSWSSGSPSLIILQFGTNESEDTTSADAYEAVFGTLIER